MLPCCILSDDGRRAVFRRRLNHSRWELAASWLVIRLACGRSVPAVPLRCLETAPPYRNSRPRERTSPSSPLPRIFANSQDRGRDRLSCGSSGTNHRRCCNRLSVERATHEGDECHTTQGRASGFSLTSHAPVSHCPIRSSGPRGDHGVIATSNRCRRFLR